MITWSIGKKCIKFLKTILDGRDAILRVRVKWMIYNIVSQLWADVKYHVPTEMLVLGDLMRFFFKKPFYHQGFFAVKRRAVFILGAKW